MIQSLGVLQLGDDRGGGALLRHTALGLEHIGGPAHEVQRAIVDAVRAADGAQDVVIADIGALSPPDIPCLDSDLIDLRSR